MKFSKNLTFNHYQIEGWKCTCGNVYYESDQAQRILLLNRLIKTPIKVKLGKNKSNLILRLPRDIEQALDLENGEEVTIQIEKNGIKIMVA